MFPDIELRVPENKQNARAMTGLLGISLVLMYQHGADQEETDRRSSKICTCADFSENLKLAILKLPLFL